MFMPISANVHWILLCILQVIVGLAHGTIWPCLSVIIANWAPVNDRGKMMGFMTAGNLF
jgi:predicted MFS family arabinose efflux permease